MIHEQNISGTFKGICMIYIAFVCNACKIELYAYQGYHMKLNNDGRTELKLIN